MRTGNLALASWRESRLDLSALERVPRAWAIAGLAVCTVAAALVIALGAGATLPGGMERVDQQTALPRALIVFAYLALALLGALVTIAHRHAGWRVPAAARLLVALFGAALAAGETPLTTGAGHWLGWTGVGLAAALVLLPRRALGHAPAALLGASPFLLALAAYALPASRHAAAFALSLTAV